jgi:hypothetical protein
MNNGFFVECTLGIVTYYPTIMIHKLVILKTHYS